MPDITVAATSQMHYNKTGSGPCLVLLHGFPESSTLWRCVADALAASFTLIMPDFPGSGDTPLEQATSLAQMADAAKDILNAEQIEKAVIAGHSMGGYVAFQFAATYPERVQGLSIIHSTPVADDDEKKANRRKAIDLIRKGGKSAFIKQMVTNLFPESFRIAHPGVVDEQINLSMQVNEDALVNYYEAMIGRNDHSAMLSAFQPPIQWIIGTEDTVIPYKKILSKCIQSRINFVTFYNNCGHMSMLECPEKLIADLTAFANYCYDPNKQA